MVGVRPCLLKGCHSNCLIRLVQDEPGPVQFSTCQPLHPLWSLLAGATVSASNIASPVTIVNTSGLLGNDDDDDDDDDRLYLRAHVQKNQTKSNFFGKA